MKVLLFVPQLTKKGGGERLVLEYLKHTKHQIHTYVGYYHPNDTYEEFRALEIRTLFPKCITKLIRILNRSKVLKGILQLLAYTAFVKLPEEEYDVVLVISGGFGELVSIAQKKKKPYLLYAHSGLKAFGEIYEKEDALQSLGMLSRTMISFAEPLYHILEKMAWRKYDIILVNSALTKNKLAKRGVHPKKMRILNPGVTTNVPSQKEQISKEKKLIYISRITPRKRQHVVVEAWQRVKNKRGFTLVIAGSVSDHKYLQRVQSAAKMSEDTLVLLNLSDEQIARVYSRAMGAVYASYKEDFGIAPLEALAYGLPLITTDSGGFFDVIKDAPAILRVRDTEDDDELKDRLTKAFNEFLARHKEYVKIGKNNAKYLESKKISWNDFAQKLDQILEDVGKKWHAEENQ